MLNTITLSTDLNTLYLVDNGRLIAYSLEKDQGVVVGMLDGQVSVVSGRRRLPPIQGNTAAPEETNEVIDSETESALLAPRPAKQVPGAEPAARTFKLPVADRNQYTVTFNEETQTVAIIGAIDIIGSREQPDVPPTGKCQLVVLDLLDHTVRLRRAGNVLQVEEIDRPQS